MAVLANTVYGGCLLDLHALHQSGLADEPQQACRTRLAIHKIHLEYYRGVVAECEAQSRHMPPLSQDALAVPNHEADRGPAVQ